MSALRPAVLPAFVCAAALLTGAPAQAEWTLDAQAGAQFDDNVSNSLEADERKADTAFNFNAAAGWHQQLTTGLGVSAAAIVDSSSYLHFSGLNNVGLGGRMQLRQKFGLGSEAPWANVFARAVHYDYHYDYRDGWQYDGGVSLGKRFGERWNFSVNAHYDRYEADKLQPTILPGVSTAAYDVSGWNLGAQGSFLLTESDTLSVVYTHRVGSVTAVTEPELEVLEYSDAVAIDPVFGSPRRIAYRLHAATDTVFLTWSHSFGAHWIANLSYGYRRAVSDEDEVGSYYSNLIGFNIGYSF
ncbi:MAG: hypothetical protein C5B46_07495 [Proteobacteria bacterium]|nr:MAG: hypothetical protein C5B46_07495 [Pseudomonadota bacterium]